MEFGIEGEVDVLEVDRVGVFFFSAADGFSSALLSSSSSDSGPPKASTVMFVRMTGLPFRPLPSFVGLPGAPSGSFSLSSFGIVIVQLSHTSPSFSALALATPHLPRGSLSFGNRGK